MDDLSIPTDAGLCYCVRILHTNSKKALIIYGGWDGHEPDKVAEIFKTALEAEGFEVTTSDSLDALNDGEALKQLDLISPCWTMGKLSDEQTGKLLDAVQSGVGLGGVHGGMGDAFRGHTNYEWMVGGHFVGHPTVGEYEVTKTDVAHPITDGFPDSLVYDSEQYYMLIDPVVEVLVDSQYEYAGKTCTMPIVWTKEWGKGRVFYSALGHVSSEFIDYPAVKEMTVRGLKWAANAL